MRCLKSCLSITATTLTATIFLVGCATQPKGIGKETKDELVVAGNEKVKLVGFMENEEGRRIRLALSREESFIISEDAVTVTMVLQLPEIEVPRHLKLEAKLNIEPGTDKADKGVHVFNGHICTMGKVNSKQGAYFSKAGWKFSLKVDGKNAPIESRIDPAELMNFQENKVQPIVGESDLTVCTKAKFPNAKEVLLTAKDRKGANLWMFQWNAPWPN